MLKFKTCKAPGCSHPFPVWVESSPETRCPPCRKRAIGETLTKSDLAFEDVHGFYAQREAGLRARIDAVEARLDALGTEAPAGRLDEVGRLRARISELTDDVARLTREREAHTRTNAEGARELARLRAENAALAQKLRVAQSPMFRDLFREPAPAAKLDPEFVTQLLKLCHPDKHGGNDLLANEVTKRLLDARRALPR